MSLLGNEDEKIGNWSIKNLNYRGQKIGPVQDCGFGGSPWRASPHPRSYFLDPCCFILTLINYLLSR